MRIHRPGGKRALGLETRLTYVQAVRAATRQLVRAGFLIEEDENRFIADAENGRVLR